MWHFQQKKLSSEKCISLRKIWENPNSLFSHATLYTVQYLRDEKLENKKQINKCKWHESSNSKLSSQSSSAIKHARKTTKQHTRLHGDSIRRNQIHLQTSEKLSQKNIKQKCKWHTAPEPPPSIPSPKATMPIRKTEKQSLFPQIFLAATRFGKLKGQYTIHKLTDTNTENRNANGIQPQTTSNKYHE